MRGHMEAFRIEQDRDDRLLAQSSKFFKAKFLYASYLGMVRRPHIKDLLKDAIESGSDDSYDAKEVIPTKSGGIRSLC